MQTESTSLREGSHLFLGSRREGTPLPPSPITDTCDSVAFASMAAASDPAMLPSGACTLLTTGRADGRAIAWTFDGVSIEDKEIIKVLSSSATWTAWNHSCEARAYSNGAGVQILLVSLNLPRFAPIEPA